MFFVLVNLKEPLAFTIDNINIYVICIYVVYTVPYRVARF